MTSPACTRDLTCYRNDGHDGPHAYPNDTRPRPVAHVIIPEALRVKGKVLERCGVRGCHRRIVVVHGGEGGRYWRHVGTRPVEFSMADLRGFG